MNSDERSWTCWSSEGSDLFITANFPPAIKVDGKITPVSKTQLSAQHTIELVRSVMNDKQAAEFESTKECNFAISPPGIGRFRVNAFVQQARVGMVLRTITMDIPKFEELGLPPVLKDIIMSKRGIMMFVGVPMLAETTIPLPPLFALTLSLTVTLMVWALLETSSPIPPLFSISTRLRAPVKAPKPEGLMSIPSAPLSETSVFET